MLHATGTKLVQWGCPAGLASAESVASSTCEPKLNTHKFVLRQRVNTHTHTHVHTFTSKK